MQKSYLLVLIGFIGLFAYPFYSNLGGAGKPPKPDINTEFINQLPKKECVLPKEEMRTEHMQILDEWRDEVVREGAPRQLRIGGAELLKSLQKGCLKCHSNTKKFCDECHKYLAVKPYCWDCHFPPTEKETDV